MLGAYSNKYGIAEFYMVESRLLGGDFVGGEMAVKGSSHATLS